MVPHNLWKLRRNGNHEQTMAEVKKMHGVPWSTLEYPGVPWSTLEYPGVPWSTLEYQRGEKD